MTADGFGDIDDGLDTAVCGPEIPSFEVVFGVFRRLVVEVLEDQPDLVGAGGFQKAASEVKCLDLLFLVGGKISGILKPDIAGAGEFGMELTFQTTDFVDGVVDEADDVELVKGQGGVGQMVADAFDEGGRHIGADFGNSLRISLMGLEVLGESGYGGGIFAGSDEQNFALVEIDEKGHVVVAATGSGLIDANLRDGGVVGFTARGIHVMVEDAPNQGVVFSDQSGGSQHGHDLDELEDESFKQQREPAVGSSPGHGNAVDTTSGAHDAWGTGVKKGLMLEEVQVAPCEGLGVVGLRRSGAEGTSKAGAARKVQIDVEASGLDGETAMVNQPRWEQS